MSEELVVRQCSPTPVSYTHLRIRQITEALEAEVIPFPGSGMSLGDIDRRLAELEARFQKLLEKAADDPIAYGDRFKEILDEQTALKEMCIRDRYGGPVYLSAFMRLQ